MDELTIWASLADALLDRHRFAKQDDHGIRLVLAIGDAPATRVGLRVRAVSAYGHPAIEIAADLGFMSAIDPWAGLRANAQLAHGALAVQGETLMLRAVLPMASLTDDALELGLQRVAAEAAALKRPVARPAASAAFAHHAE